MGRNSTLKNGLILIAIPLVLQAAFLVLLLGLQAEVRSAQTWAIHTKEVIVRVESIYRQLSEGQSEARAAVVAEDVAPYMPFGRAMKTVVADLDELREMVEDNPAQRANANRIAAATGELLDWQDEVRGLVTSGRLVAAVERVRDQSGKEKLDRLRMLIDEFLAEEERLDRDRMAVLERLSRRQGITILVGGVAALATTLGLLLAVSRGVRRRFHILIDNARRVAEGKEIASPLKGHDELAELDRAFHAMARSIAEKDRENELFIYSVTHDLRSPLVNLQGFSQELTYAGTDLAGLLRDESVPAPIRLRGLAVVDGDMAESVRYIRTAVSRLSVIIDSLLRLSRAGRVEYRWTTVDVEEKVGRVVEALGVTIAGRAATVRVVGPLPPAWGDPTAVEQVFANLVGNAVNYLDPSRPGLVEIGAIGAEDPSYTPGRSAYYIRDNGLGIPEAGMAKLFMAFQRFHDGRAPGEGIGLALVRKIVERHGGRIWAESAQDQGTTFRVDLPSVAPPRPQPSSETSPATR